MNEAPEWLRKLRERKRRRKIKKIFFVLGVRGGKRQSMLGVQGQPARVDSFLFSSFPTGGASAPP